MVKLEDDVLDSLEDLGYTEQIPEALEQAWQDGPRSPEYTRLVAWLSQELGGVCGLEEQVNPITNPDDANSFLMELSSLLRELHCPYKSLTESDANSQKLATREQRLQLIDFLCTELQAARMLSFKNPGGFVAADTITLEESETAQDLKLMLIALGMSKPPKEITTQQLFTKVQEKLKEHKDAIPAEFVGRPLLSGGNLSPEQWKELERLNQDMNQQYKMRAEMLLKRLDVTIQSFTWSDRIKLKQDEVSAIYRPRRAGLRPESRVNVSDILAARNDLTTIEKTCGTKERQNTQSALHKVLMGKVPDRGGRPDEIEPPPPEMPSWMQRQPGTSGGRGGGRGQRGGSGGDHRGGGGGGGGGGRSDNQNWHANQGQGNWQAGGGTFQMYGNSGGGGGGGRGGGGAGGHGYAGFNGGGGYQGGGGGYQHYGGDGMRGRNDYGGGHGGGGDYRGGGGRGGRGRGGRGNRY